MECNPDGENPCCNQKWNGVCGNTTEHCSCPYYRCTDYKFLKDWKQSGGKLKWRNDGKCGLDYRLPDGNPAECNPDGENPCCNQKWNGVCGNTTEHCSCPFYYSCTDYKFLQDWKQSGGKLKWRNDGKCGGDYPLPDGNPAECNPDGENPCCHLGVGVCGNTTEHCTCDRYCTDYKLLRDWNESNGTKKWRYDGRCGQKYLLPDDTPAQCNPNGENPCCNSREDGVCGNTTQNCFCEECTNFSRIFWEWRESSGNQKWRYDGLCGRKYPLPDGTPAECDPDGENPCCDSYGKCGKTTKHCLCYDCVNYMFVKDWKESGGTLKVRYAMGDVVGVFHFLTGLRVNVILMGINLVAGAESVVKHQTIVFARVVQTTSL